MKELREHCSVSLPTLFSVVLQKGWWEVTTTVGTGKEGPWGGILRWRHYRGGPPGWGGPAYTAPCLNVTSWQCQPALLTRMYNLFMWWERCPLNCYFFLLRILNKYKRLNYWQLKLSLWWQPNRSNGFPRTSHWQLHWGSKPFRSSCRLRLGMHPQGILGPEKHGEPAEVISIGLQASFNSVFFTTISLRLCRAPNKMKMETTLFYLGDNQISLQWGNFKTG